MSVYLTIVALQYQALPILLALGQQITCQEMASDCLSDKFDTFPVQGLGSFWQGRAISIGGSRRLQREEVSDSRLSISMCGCSTSASCAVQ